MQGGTFLSALFLWLFIKRRIGRQIRLSWNAKHIRPIISLFIPLLAMSIYHMMDKTMLGILSTNAESGFYYNADKVINIPVSILTGFGTVLLPRISSLVTENRRQEADDLFLKSIEIILFLTTAVVAGIASIAKEFVPVFFGDGYEPCVFLIILLAPALVIKGLSIIIRTEYLIPRNEDSCYIKSVIIGAIVNMVANVLLIPRLGASGAVLGTLLAEIVACLWQCISIMKKVPISLAIAKGSIYVAFSLIMFLIVKLVGKNTVQFGSILQLLTEIVSGAVVYLVLSFLYWKFTNNDLIQYIRRT